MTKMLQDRVRILLLFFQIYFIIVLYLQKPFKRTATGEVIFPGKKEMVIVETRDQRVYAD